MKRPTLSRSLKVLGPLAAALSLTVAAASPASANPSIATRQGSEVQWTAFSNEDNRLSVFNNGGVLNLQDTDGILPGPNCTAVNPTLVTCGPTAGTTRLRLSSGDWNDLVSVDAALTIPADVDGGAGQDVIIGGAGADRLRDPDGWPTPPMGATFAAGAGNDQVVSWNGGYDVVDCGPGFDTAVVDRFRDTVYNCEYVIRY
ncbi:MAG: hypothetical protein HOV68_04330 [Streptomycetaceae bacterium]|nr:hypothetical protein [Streptomycetaceae bacterium]